MCGFVGYIGPKAPVNRAQLVRMNDALSHRGPDDANVYVHEEAGIAVGLGHRRLSILDTRPVGRQPMSAQNQQTWITYNGEFYTYRAHRERLSAMGYAFKTRTDTEVILALYAEHGLSCLEHIDGMFGFAIWDQSARRLLLARDRFGIKPVFYGLRPDGTLLFGSEVKALLAANCLDDGIDIQAHHDYLGLNYVPGSQTMLKGIRKLPPAHMLVWENGEIRIQRYWSQHFHSETDRPFEGSFNDAAAELRSHFQAAVNRRLISDVPLGMFLSGGIDSSAVLMAMAKYHDGPVKAFTIAFEESGYDESEYARIAASRFSADHHVELVRPDPDTFLAPLIETLDEPYADSSAIPLWYLCRMARRDVTVALGGDGGDEVFAGYRSHFAWQLARLWRHLPRVLRQTWATKIADWLPVSHKKVSLDLKVRAFVGAASLPPIDAHYRFKEFMSEPARNALLGSDTDVSETVRLFRKSIEHMTSSSSLDAILTADFGLYLPDDILVKVDRMSMAHSLEARVPFLDHKLVEFAARLPANYKLRGLTTKAVLKHALKGHIPTQLLQRRKAGFNVPMAKWLSGPLKPLLLDLLSTDSVRRVGLWDPDTVEQTITTHFNRERDNSRTLWAMMCFMLFNERYRQGRPA
jgi:asparagine synthase (glutamine-hydrolysing)